MSGYTLTQPELYYSESISGTALNTFTTEASLMGGYPIPQIPATFFNKTGVLSSAIKLRAYCALGDTSTAPTFAITVRLLTSATSWSAAGLGWASTACTMSNTSATNNWAQLDGDLTLRTLAAGAATSTLDLHGTWTGNFTTTGTLPVAGTAGTLSTFDATGATQYFLWLSATCGTSNASNSISLQTLKIYLEN